jgi:hypothetical protein
MYEIGIAEALCLLGLWIAATGDEAPIRLDTWHPRMKGFYTCALAAIGLMIHAFVAPMFR